MKKVKILITTVVLFLAANVSVASAQNDSIYGLEVSIVDNVLNFSFNSTYDLNNLRSVVVSYYKGSTEDWNLSSFWGSDVIEYNNNVLSSYFGEGSIDIIDENIYKINISNCILDNFLRDKSYRLRIYIRGVGYTPPSNSLNIQTLSSSIGESNMLTFFFNPLIETSLNEAIIDENYTYKYFLLSGKETQKQPIGMPFVQIIYKGEKPMFIDKYIK